MKKNHLLTAIILFTVTAFTACKTTSNLQCDEVYVSDYNCVKPQVNMYVPGGFFAPVHKVYGYPTYYYNTVYIDNCCDVPTSPPVTNLPRPSIYHNGRSQSEENAVENTQNEIHRKPQVDAPSSRKTRD